MGHLGEADQHDDHTGHPDRAREQDGDEMVEIDADAEKPSSIWRYIGRVLRVRSRHLAGKDM